MLRRQILPLTVALTSFASASWAAGPQDLYYERTLMARAGARCSLFAPKIVDALAASARQAQGAALRAGADPSALDAAAGRALAKADAVACSSPDLKRAAGRVKAAFDGWASLKTMRFPGRRSVWTAERADRPAVPRWTLFTPFRSPDGPARVGLTSQDGGDALTAVVGASLAGAYAVRLVLRDPAKAPDPYLAVDGAPPRDASLAILAADRGPAPASLQPTGLANGVIVRFPPSAAEALARLDPRESARLEWAFPTRGGERVTSVLIEAGDFAAGRAFLSVGR